MIDGYWISGRVPCYVRVKNSFWIESGEGSVRIVIDTIASDQTTLWGMTWHFRFVLASFVPILLTSYWDMVNVVSNV